MRLDRIIADFRRRDAIDAPGWVTLLKYSLPPLALTLLYLIGTRVNYLLFHVLAELISIVIALTAMVVATTSRRFTQNHFVVYIAVAIGWCAGLDLFHALVFKGMGLLGSGSANPATQLWIAARFIQAVALLSAPLLLRRSVRIEYVHLAYGLAATGCALLISYGHFPTAYVDGIGLTGFKIYTEYLIILILACALLFLWYQRQLMNRALFVSLNLAVSAMILSEFAFTQYISVYGSANLVGHILKIFAYWFVYAALVQSTLREPFGMLARAASTYDAVPDPTLIVALDGTIRQANQAAAVYADLPVEALVGRASHALFHDADIPAADCPVCARIARRGAAFSIELERQRGRAAVECSIAPMGAGIMGDAYVQVVRDISERRRLAAEREHLVLSLGERVKELRCLYAITLASEMTDNSPESLLRETARLLPPGFLYADQACVSIESDWGHFGTTQTRQSTHLLVRSVRVHERTVASVMVFYPDQVAAGGDPFLPEEQQLMDSVARHLGEAIERMIANQRVRQLSYLYEMLSATNRAIVHCRSDESLMSTVFDALCTHSAFPMLFIARTESGGLPMRITHSHGIDVARLPLLTEVLSDENSPFGQLLSEFSTGQLVCRPIPQIEQNQVWLAYLHQAHLQHRAFLPLLQAGRLVGVIGLYTNDTVPFDADQRKLLNEMGEDLGFALTSLQAEQRRVAAEAHAEFSEHRFSEVFQSSPLPMQIMSVSTGKVVALNRAILQWLGYAPEELSTVEDWFQRVYVDPAVQQQLGERWQQDVELARTSGMPVQSPELELRCKDGSRKRAIGTVTALGDDVIVAWMDLTEIRRQGKALEESEQRFRGMIEQNVTGIYVRLGESFVYVNPRFCEMIGKPSEALLGQRIMDCIDMRPETVAEVKRQWMHLEQSRVSASYTVPVFRADGSEMQLGLHVTPITWDGQPAYISMAQDVTERKHAEEQIQRYVRQLETSMYGTLQAVSNMVDLRDPYTAGHERRVGQIAAAIAAELGWEPVRCKAIEMIGLVHDIGKIAVPAELLSKPSRLTELEMQMVRQHAEAGYQILKDVEFPYPVAEIIHQHHERIDGSGYPRGLKGEAILIEARVLAVADVLESMSSHRPYRPAVGLEAALSELQAGRDKLFDPLIVDTVVHMIRDKGYILPG